MAKHIIIIATSYEQLKLALFFMGNDNPTIGEAYPITIYNLSAMSDAAAQRAAGFANATVFPTKDAPSATDAFNEIIESIGISDDDLIMKLDQRTRMKTNFNWADSFFTIANNARQQDIDWLGAATPEVLDDRGNSQRFDRLTINDRDILKAKQLAEPKTSILSGAWLNATNGLHKDAGQSIAGSMFNRLRNGKALGILENLKERA